MQVTIIVPNVVSLLNYRLVVLYVIIAHGGGRSVFLLDSLRTVDCSKGTLLP